MIKVYRKTIIFSSSCLNELIQYNIFEIDSATLTRQKNKKNKIK